MKQIIFVLLLFCLCIAAGAQKIKKMEYYFDVDPGVGKAKALAITAADTVTISTTITINNLTQGLHSLYMRARTDTGWGLSESFLFTVYDSALAQPVAREEYFFDNDPGVGKATTIPITAADTVKLLQTIPTGNLPEGLHTLYVRLGNSNGYYSLTENALFYVTAFAENAPKIAGAEYFIDTDPGTGKAKKINTGAQTDTLRTTYDINIPAGLDTAINHYLCIRVKDANGAWSLYELDTFKVTATVNIATLKISAVKDGAHIVIQWNTYNSNAINYTVEKSIDGIGFTTLGNVAAKSAQQAYNTKDAAPVNGVNFYRIKQTNTTGDISYSSITKVLFNPVDEVVDVYPNPAKDIVNISFNSNGKDAFANIFDARGRWVKMYNTTVGKNMQINISSLAAGTYILHISDGEKTFTGKIIKQ